MSGGSFGIRHVQRTFAAAYETIAAAMLQRAVEIEARIAGTYTSLRGDVDPESRSILGCIIGVSQEVRLPAKRYSVSSSNGGFLSGSGQEACHYEPLPNWTSA